MLNKNGYEKQLTPQTVTVFNVYLGTKDQHV